MKFIRILSATLIGLFCLPAHATLCDQFCWTKGYVGGSLLVEQNSADQTRFRGLHPRISLGLADRSNNYYMGGEVFLTPSTITLSDVKYKGAASARDSLSYGAGFLPGVRLYHDIFGFGRVGAVVAKFSSPNIYKLGLQLGLGLQTWFTKELAIRGEYNYTTFSEVTKIGSINSNEIGLGLIYFFG